MKISSFPLSILPVGNNCRVVQIFFTLNSTVKICTLKHVYRYHCSFFLFMSFCAQTVPGTQRYIMKTKVHSMKKISFCPLPLLPVWAIACSIGFSRVRGGYWWVSDIASFLCVYKNFAFMFFAIRFFHSKHSLVWTHRCQMCSETQIQRCSNFSPFSYSHCIGQQVESSLGFVFVFQGIFFLLSFEVF